MSSKPIVITNAAHDAQRNFLNSTAKVVPCDNGGVQIEWHLDGWDIEVEFGPRGKIRGVLVAREDD